MHGQPAALQVYIAQASSLGEVRTLLSLFSRPHLVCQHLSVDAQGAIALKIGFISRTPLSCSWILLQEHHSRHAANVQASPLLHWNYRYEQL